MVRFVFRRAVHAFFLILITVSVTFVAVQLAPGDALSRYYSPDVDPAAMARVRAQLGLDDPVHVQFARWLGSFLKGDFGISLTSHREVADILGETIPRTLLLTSLAFLVQLITGIVVGMVAAARRGSRADRALSLSSLAIYAIPAFYLAYLLILVFSLRLDLLPTSGMASIDMVDAKGWGAFVDRARHLILPVVVLGVANAAWFARFTRGSVLDSLTEDFIRTARAKGASEKRVLWTHAFRNALPPLLTMVGLSVPFLLGGAVVVERVFAWPGAGTLMVDAIFARDYPVVLAVNCIGAGLVIMGNLLADISTVLADPRTKLASWYVDARGA